MIEAPSVKQVELRRLRDRVMEVEAGDAKALAAFEAVRRLCDLMDGLLQAATRPDGLPTSA